MKDNHDNESANDDTVVFRTAGFSSGYSSQKRKKDGAIIMKNCLRIYFVGNCS